MSDDIYTIYLLNYAFIIIYKLYLLQVHVSWISRYTKRSLIIYINTSLITVDSLLIIKPFLNLTFKNKDS